MDACPAHPRRVGFWPLIMCLTALLTLEPGLLLVGLSLALSALALTWIVMLAKFLLLDALARHPSTGLS